MSREMTSGQEAERVRTGKDVYWLLEIDVPGAGTQYFSQRKIIISGNVYKDKLQRFTDQGKVLRVGFNPADVLGLASGMDFVIRSLPEDDDRFSDLIRDFGLDGNVVRLGLVFKPAGASPTSADITWYHTYLVDTYEIGTQVVSIRCVDITEYFLDKVLGRLINNDDWPRAPETSYGLFAPVIIGEATDCPAIPVDVGARTLLNGSLLASEEVISVASVIDFADPGAGGYQIQIGQELILVREIDRINKTFGTSGTPCERGYAGTDAEGYVDGTAVHEIRDNYIYLVADHLLHDVSNVRIGGRLIVTGYSDFYDSGLDQHFIGFTERPIAIVPAPGSAIERIDGSVDEDGVTPVWDWVVLGDNSAENPGGAFDADQLFTFARIGTGEKLSIRNQNNLSNGESLYGRFKKLRLGIEYQCSKRWGDETFPYIQILRNGGLVGTIKYLQKPSEEDERIKTDEHDHQERSDWSIGDSRRLFEVGLESDVAAVDPEKSKSQIFGGSYWKEFVFKDVNKLDETYRIEKIIWKVVFDGAPKTGLMKIRLANGRLYQKYYDSFSVPDEKILEVQVEDVGDILFLDIIEGNILFRVEGLYDSNSFITLASVLEIYSKAVISGQETALDQAQDQNRTELMEVDGKSVTSRVTQVIDYSVAARDLGGWAFFNGAIDVKIFFNNEPGNDDTEIYILNVFWDVEYQPLTEQFATGDVVCDVQGLELPGDVYYDNPVDILENILLKHYGGVGSGYIDGDSFAAVKSAVSVIAPIVGRWIGEKRTLRELVNTLVTDINARLIFEGTKFYLRDRTKYFNVDDSVLEIDDDYFRETSINKVRSSGKQIFNQLGIYYYRRPGKDWFRRNLEINDLLSQQEAWGVRRETYDSWWHGDNGTAVRWVGDRALAWAARKYTITNITNTLNLIHLARGDIAQLTHERSDLEGQVAQIVGTRILEFDKYEIKVAYQDALRIFQTDKCRVEVDQSAGRFMKFFANNELLAILYDSGDFEFKNDFNFAGTAMLKGNDPAGDDLFVCQLLAGDAYALRVPLPQSAGQAWHPLAVIGIVGVVRLYGARMRTGVANLSETINDYVEWSVGEWVKLAPNGTDVVAKFEQKGIGDPDYPGIWTFKGSLKERAL